MTVSNGQSTWAHTNVYAGGMLLATYDLKGLHFHLADWLGNRRVQTNALGQVEETCKNSPFGNDLACAYSPNANDATEHHFTGKERDAESGLDYFGARYYGSTLGRFMSPDWAAKAEPVPYAKLDVPQSLNLYSYVGNDPLGKADADGHDFWRGLSDKIQGWFGTSAQMLNDGLRRMQYTSSVKQLTGPGKSLARTQLQTKTYNRLSALGRAVTENERAGRQGQLAGKSAIARETSATRSNAAVDAMGVRSTVAGAIGVAATVAVIAVETANAPDGEKAQTAVESMGRAGGSLVGAELGGTIGGAAGGVPGAILGGVLGGVGGDKFVHTMQTQPAPVMPSILPFGY